MTTVVLNVVRREPIQRGHNMTIRLIDPETGDIVTSGQQFVFGDLPREEISQTIQTRLRLFTGEYFRNIEDGTPWFEVILEKNTPLSQRDAVIRRRILQTPGVLQITRYESNYDIPTRQLTITGEVLTPQGLISIQDNESIR